MADLKQWVRVRCEYCSGTGRLRRVNPRWLRHRRMRVGMSVRAMARHLGLSAAYISDVERGRRNGNQAILIAYRELAHE